MVVDFGEIPTFAGSEGFIPVHLRGGEDTDVVGAAGACAVGAVEHHNAIEFNGLAQIDLPPRIGFLAGRVKSHLAVLESVASPRSILHARDALRVGGQRFPGMRVFACIQDELLILRGPLRLDQDLHRFALRRRPSAQRKDRKQPKTRPNGSLHATPPVKTR